MAWLLEHLTRSGETITESAVLEGAVTVDREAGVIRGVKLLGLKSRNGRRYNEGALAEAVAKYEGAKVNVNHPKGSPSSPRDYQDRLGAIRGVEYRRGDGLYGDLYFNPKHGISEQLAWDAEHAPQNVGMSHNIRAKTRRDKNELVVEAISKVQSVDLVADPAATDGLFEHEGMTLGEVVAVHKESDSPVLPILEAFVADPNMGQQMGKAAVMPQMQQPGQQQNSQLLGALKTAINALIDDESLSLDEVIDLLKKKIGANPEDALPEGGKDDEDQDMFDDPEKKKKFQESVTELIDAATTPLLEELARLTKERDARALLDSFHTTPATIGAEKFKALMEAEGEAAMKTLLESWPPALRGAQRPAVQTPAAPRKTPRLIHARR